MGENTTGVNQYVERLEKHELQKVPTADVSAFYMKDPAQGRCQSMLLIFSPEGIAIVGDWTPERNGSVSALGYGVNWFAGTLSRDYLCSKFLEKKWSREKAEDDLKWSIEGNEDAAECERITEVIDDLDDETGSESFADMLADNDLWSLMDDGLPGMGYLPNEADLLCAIQQRFAELYHAANSPVLTP